MRKVAAYSGSRNLYPDMVTACKSLILNSDVEKIYLLIEDDTFPYEMPDMVETINVSNQTFFKPGTPNMKSNFTYFALMRIALCHVLPDEDVVLSLDIDTIVDKDISDIWDIDLTDYYFAAAIEPHRSFGGLIYTNGGVVLYNLAKLRDGKADECIEVLNRQEFTWVDQDVENYLCQGHIKLLDPGYNDTDWTIRPNSKKIIHFAGIKQWNHLPLVSLYKVMTWNEVLERRFQNEKENNY